jgi:hypothetical protein
MLQTVVFGEKNSLKFRAPGNSEDFFIKVAQDTPQLAEGRNAQM